MSPTSVRAISSRTEKGCCCCCCWAGDGGNGEAGGRIAGAGSIKGMYYLTNSLPCSFDRVENLSLKKMAGLQFFKRKKA